MATTFQKVDLYGGAITAEIPKGYNDASNIRQIPNHQEVFLDEDGFTSIIFEINEYVDAETAKTDEDALKYHYQDMVSDNNDETKHLMASNASLGKMPNIPAHTLAATQTPPAAPPTANPKKLPDFTGVFLILVRLVEQKTDIVITINVPHVAGEYVKEDVDLPAQKLGPLMQKAVEIKMKVLETFEIKDWDLFVN